MKLKMVRGLESNMPVNIGRAVPGDSIFNKISPQPPLLEERGYLNIYQLHTPLLLKEKGLGDEVEMEEKGHTNMIIGAC